jgi:hypothetical protein
LPLFLAVSHDPWVRGLQMSDCLPRAERDLSHRGDSADDRIFIVSNPQRRMELLLREVLGTCSLEEIELYVSAVQKVDELPERARNQPGSPGINGGKQTIVDERSEVRNLLLLGGWDAQAPSVETEMFNSGKTASYAE